MFQTPITVSIIICTHNQSEQLGLTLKECAKVLGSCAVRSEVLVCANGCSQSEFEATKALAEKFDTVPARFIYRSQSGKTASMIDGVLSASGSIGIILDDDNSILPYWIETAVNYLEKNPNCGVVGCNSVLPENVHVDERVKPFLQHYAVGNQFNMCRQRKKDFCSVWGAGMAFKLNPLKQWIQLGNAFLLGGRVGKKLLAGEDTELCLLYTAWGWTVEAINFTGIVHRVDPGRLEVQSLKRLWRSESEAFQIYRNYVENIRLYDLNSKTLLKNHAVVVELFRSCCVIVAVAVACLISKNLWWMHKRENHIGRIIGLKTLFERRREIQRNIRFQNICRQ
jgi:glycosyltransferase involved in cell wall biosynthesis